MSSRTRSRRPASIGSNQSSRSGIAVLASDCAARDFVLLLVMAWSPPARQRRHCLGFNHPETTPPSIPTTRRTAPFHQMIEDRLLVHQQPVVTAVQLVDFRQPGILTQPVGQRAALKPLTMQAPFAARRQPAVGDQRTAPDPNASPRFREGRLFAAHAQPLRPELIELQLAPQHQRQPAAPHCRGRRRRNSDNLTPTTEASASSPSTRSSANSDSVRRRAAPSSKTAIDRRHASSCVSLISPRYSTCRCTTRPPATRVFSTTLQ